MINRLIPGNLRNILLIAFRKENLKKKMMILNIWKMSMFHLNQLNINIPIILEPKEEIKKFNLKILLKNNKKNQNNHFLLLLMKI